MHFFGSTSSATQRAVAAILSRSKKRESRTPTPPFTRFSSIVLAPCFKLSSLSTVSRGMEPLFLFSRTVGFTLFKDSPYFIGEKRSHSGGVIKRETLTGTKTTPATQSSHRLWSPSGFFLAHFFHARSSFRLDCSRRRVKNILHTYTSTREEEEET